MLENMVLFILLHYFVLLGVVVLSHQEIVDVLKNIPEHAHELLPKENYCCYSFVKLFLNKDNAHIYCNLSFIGTHHSDQLNEVFLLALWQRQVT